VTARQAAPTEVVVVGPGARRGGCGDCGVSQKGGFGKLVLYCFRGCWWGGIGRAQSPMCPKAVVCPKAEEVALESLFYTASEVVGGEGWVEPRAQWCPKAVVCPKAEEVVWPTCNVPKKTVSRRLVAPRFPPKISPQPNEGGVPRRCVLSGRKKVVYRSGERRWCDGRVKVVDATTQNRAKSKKEQPETEHQNA
jgi:hypothetical protein